MRATACISLLATLAACTVGPDFHAAHVVSPPTFAYPITAAPGVAFGATVDIQWWRTFSDPELDSLIDRLGRQNLDLQVAAERIEQARDQTQIAEGQGLPQIGASMTYTRQRESPNGFLSLVQPTLGAPLAYDQYQPTIQASWELDLFGKVRRSVEAAQANTLAAQEARRGVALAAIAELAQTYMEFRTAQAQEQILRRNILLALKDDTLIQDRFRDGTATTLDVAQADAQLAQTRQQLPPVIQQEASLSNSIALLLGEPPESLTMELTQTVTQPSIPHTVAVGLPSELILRRPDICEAEANLHVATAETGIATASFYPDITLSGSFGFDSLHTSTLFDWASRTFALSPSVSLPIFEGGQLRGTLALRKSQQREAAIAFYQTVLLAWHDVDNALTAYGQAQQARGDALTTEQADERAVAAAEQQYQYGAADYLNVVAAQTSQLAGQNGVVMANAEVETSLVELYKALGGGWQGIQPNTQVAEAEK